MPIFGGIVTGIPAAESALWLQKRLVGESGTSLYKQANRDLEKFIRDNHHADLIRIDTARNQ
jgi:hypothetical protein